MPAGGRTMGLNPADILHHKFSRSFLGGVDPEEVRAFLADVATTLNRALSELADARARCASMETALAHAETRLADAERPVGDLTARNDEVTRALAAEETARRQAETSLAEVRAELAAARQKLAVFEERDSHVAGVLLNTQKIADQMMRAAQEDAGKLLGAALAEKERLAADSKAEAERLVKDAQATSEGVIAKAQTETERLVADAKAAADSLVTAASAAARRLTADAEEASAKARAEADAHVGELTGRVKRLLDLNATFSQTLDAVRARHGELLAALAEVHADADQRVLPLLDNWRRILQGTLTRAPAMAEPERDDTESGLEGSRDIKALREPHRREAALEEAPFVSLPAVTPAGTAATPDGDEDGAHTTEIVVSPFATFFEAAEFLTALSRLAEVRKVRIRTLSQGVANFEVAVAGDAGLDVSRLEGHPVQVVERGETRLVLRRRSLSADH
jgi:DivIVA domain-containing protein